MASLKFPAGCPEALGRSFPRDYTSSMTTMFDGSRTRPPCSSSSSINVDYALNLPVSAVRHNNECLANAGSLF